MANRLIFIIFLLVTIVGDIKAQDTESVLVELDDVITRRERYHKIVQHSIDSLKAEVKGADDEKLVRVYGELFDHYNNYQVDSALHYINKLLSMTQVKNDYYRNVSVNLKKSITYGLMGDFCTAMQIVDTIDVSNAPQDVRSEYFHTCRTVYGWNAEYVKGKRDNDNYLEKLTQMYRDSILQNTPPDVRRSIVMADNCIVNGDADAAIDILIQVLPHAQQEQKNYAYYNLSECYRVKGDRDKRIFYLALTAIADIKSGVTEYTALPQLANLMYESGDLSRAYYYLFCSMEDAHFCNAFIRTMEVHNIFPIIDKEYRGQQQRNQMFEHLLLTGLSVLAILLIIAFFYLQLQMRRTNAIRKTLADTNERLAEANSKLASANSQLEDANEQLQGYNSQLGANNDFLSRTNEVKEEYIAHYLELCRGYMDTFENFRKSLLKYAKNNQHAEVLKMLKTDDVMEEEHKKFYADFDRSFLSIHPDFIESFNALLKEDARIVPKKGELLNTELRIFALIRLGVEDTAMIAHFLNYSMPTIYNYRSRVRNCSVYDKDEFYSRLMAIS